jgi:hypothetical protein
MQSPSPTSDTASPPLRTPKAEETTKTQARRKEEEPKTSMRARTYYRRKVSSDVDGLELGGAG